jgi:hypothetical protein
LGTEPLVIELKGGLTSGTATGGSSSTGLPKSEAMGIKGLGQKRTGMGRVVAAGLTGGIGAGIGMGMGLGVFNVIVEVLQKGFAVVIKVLGVLTTLLGLLIMPIVNFLIPLLMPLIYLLTPIVRMLNLLLRPILTKMMTKMKDAAGKGSFDILGVMGVVVEGFSDLFSVLLTKVIGEGMKNVNNIIATSLEVVIVVLTAGFSALAKLVPFIGDDLSEAILDLGANAVGTVDEIRQLLNMGIDSGVQMITDSFTKMNADALPALDKGLDTSQKLVIAVAKTFDKDFGQKIEEVFVGVNKHMAEVWAPYFQQIIKQSADYATTQVQGIFATFANEAKQVKELQEALKNGMFPYAGQQSVSAAGQSQQNAVANLLKLPEIGGGTYDAQRNITPYNLQSALSDLRGQQALSWPNKTDIVLKVDVQQLNSGFSTEVSSINGYNNARIT